MEATRSSEKSVYNKPIGRHIPEGGILHSHRRENLESYNNLDVVNVIALQTLQCTKTASHCISLNIHGMEIYFQQNL
jgi:hypothetical protein